MKILDIGAPEGDFHLLQTTPRVQTATMRLEKGSATSETMEVHPSSDQVVLLLEGDLIAEIGDTRTTLGPHQSVIVPAGMRHRFVNAVDMMALAFTVYGPPAYGADEAK